MYSLQILRLSRRGPHESDPGRNIFLQISTEGQTPRKFHVGNTARGTSHTLQSLVHVVTSPVTLQLFYGPRLFEQIGIRTLVDFLIPRTKEKGFIQPPKIKTLTFQTRGNTETYTLSYSIRPITESYTFVLRSISCMRQFSVSFDRVYAEVEFNHCPHNILPPLTSRYHLGNMRSQDSSRLHSSQNCTFNAVGNFVVTLYAKSRFSEHRLGTIVFIPENELVLPPSTLQTEPPSGGGRISGVWGSNTILLGSESFFDKRIVLTTSSGASYDVHFTMQKRNRQPIPTNDQNSSAPRLLPPSEWDKTLSVTKSPTLPFTVEDEHFVVDNQNITAITYANECEVLIDGEATFKRYYEAMMGSMHSITIVGWELSLSFGLVPSSQIPQEDRSILQFLNPKWVSLQDVLIHKAMAGVRVKILVWRHEWLSYLNRLIYLGEVTIEREVEKFELRCKSLGLIVRVFHALDSIIAKDSPYGQGIGQDDHDANIVIVIVGNPSGIVSCYHEKIVLVDGECEKHAVCFVGGFDIARGRYDSTNHNPPPPIYADITGGSKRHPNNDWNVQPLLKQIRFLWHDVQVMIRGPTCQQVRLHVDQRWSHAFGSNIVETRQRILKIPFSHSTCDRKSSLHQYPYTASVSPHCVIRFHRCWPGVIDGHLLLDAHVRMIQKAKKFIYIEHQYPFQNFTLAQAMCESLVANPNLKVIIIAPLKTDLPSGIVGDLFDQSQDHINSDLSLIYEAAPERVGIYFLLRQEPITKKLKPIYVHSKLWIVDDDYIEIGSANTDNLSYYRSSEVNVTIQNPRLARMTRVSLMKEHLDSRFTPIMEVDFAPAFDAFRKVADANRQSTTRSGVLVGRPVHAVPDAEYQHWRDLVDFPSSFSKLWYKMGLSNVHDRLWFQWNRLRSRGGASTLNTPSPMANLAHSDAMPGDGHYDKDESEATYVDDLRARL